jgi:hypothetical protein
MIKIGVINVSDRASAGIYEDIPGKAVVELLHEYLTSPFEVIYAVIPDEQALLEAKMIEEIFEQLKDLGAVSSTDDFSTKWLGRERSYMRCLRAKQRDPSAQVLATCAVRLLRTADSVGTTMPWSRRDSLRSLANTCLEALLSTGVRP